jgi:hypothetical protein
MGRWAVSNPLDRRLTALEQALGVSRVVWRVFGTAAEADADAEPAGPGVEVLRIVTGVSRLSGASTP